MRGVLVALLLVIPVAAAAQPAEPAGPPGSVGLVEEAEALAAAGKFVDAAKKFRAAHEISPQPELLCNVGVAYYKARDLPRAHLYLGQCLVRAGSLDAAFLESVRNVLAAVEAKLREGDFAPVDVRVKPESTAFVVSAFDPDEAIHGSRVVWLPFGTHTITFSAEGYVDRTEPVDIADRTQATVQVTLQHASVGAHQGDGDPDRPAVPGTPRSRTPAIIATIATGVVGLAGLGAYLIARSKASDAGETGISVPVYDRRVSSARQWQHVSWGLAAAAGAGAVVSGFLWYRATRSTTTVIEVEPTAGGGAAVTFAGRF